MMFRTISVGVLVIGMAGAQPAIACEFHDMGFGPMGSKWSAYYPGEHVLFEDDAKDTSLTNPTDEEGKSSSAVTAPPPAPRRPTFSSASIRAANTAKAKLAKLEPGSPAAKAQISKADR